MLVEIEVEVELSQLVIDVIVGDSAAIIDAMGFLDILYWFATSTSGNQAKVAINYCV